MSTARIALANVAADAGVAVVLGTDLDLTAATDLLATRCRTA